MQHFACNNILSLCNNNKILKFSSFLFHDIHYTLYIERNLADMNTIPDTLVPQIIQTQMLSTISTTNITITSATTRTSTTTVAQPLPPPIPLLSPSMRDANKIVPDDDEDDDDDVDDVDGTPTTITVTMAVVHSHIVSPSLSLASPLLSSSMTNNNAKHQQRTKIANIQMSSSLRSMQISRTAIKSSPSATNSTAPKSHKPDAPNMLNYIFDSHLATNKHHHHDRYVFLVRIHWVLMCRLIKKKWQVK